MTDAGALLQKKIIEAFYEKESVGFAEYFEKLLRIALEELSANDKWPNAKINLQDYVKSGDFQDRQDAFGGFDLFFEEQKKVYLSITKYGAQSCRTAYFNLFHTIYFLGSDFKTVEVVEIETFEDCWTAILDNDIDYVRSLDIKVI